jgi:hypothetical protein
MATGTKKRATTGIRDYTLYTEGKDGTLRPFGDSRGRTAQIAYRAFWDKADGKIRKRLKGQTIRAVSTRNLADVTITE